MTEEFLQSCCKINESYCLTKINHHNKIKRKCHSQGSVIFILLWYSLLFLKVIKKSSLPAIPYSKFHPPSQSHCWIFPYSNSIPEIPNIPHYIEYIFFPLPPTLYPKDLPLHNYIFNLFCILINEKIVLYFYINVPNNPH